MEVNEKTFLVTQEHHKKRIDIFLAEVLPQFSRAKIQSFIKNKLVLINSKWCKPSKEIKVNDEIKIIFQEDNNNQIIPQEMAIEILYEDNWLLAINKPAGVVTCPTPKFKTHTLINYLAFKLPEISPVGGIYRYGILHRLDKDTSGALLIAKDENSFNNISLQFKERKIEKYYLAIAFGKIVDHISNTINKPIGRDFKEGKRMKICGRRARFATTKFKAIKTTHNLHLLSIKPVTGRTHQIRVHMASIGLPIIGDKMYLKSKKLKYILSHLFSCNKVIPYNRPSRQLLHAYKITFIHPVYNVKKNIIAPIPTEMSDYIKTFFGEVQIKDEELHI